MSANTSQGSCSTPAVGANGDVTCALATMPGQTVATVLVTVKVTAPSGTTLTNTATVNALTFDPNLANNSSTNATTVAPPIVNASSFDFGQDLVNTLLTKTVSTITNATPNAAPITISLSGDSSFTLLAAQSCGAQIPANSSCPLVVAYDPAVAGIQKGTVNVQFTNGNITPSSIALKGTAGTVESGTVTTTINPQVALYTITPPFKATVTVQFGPDTNYGFMTSPQATATSAGGVSIFVAGMLPTRVYHMRAVVTFANGQTFTDSDHIFTTGAVPGGYPNSYPATTTAGFTPQPGIELINPVIGGPLVQFATDLQGNIIWTYVVPEMASQPKSIVQGFKQLPNGHYIAVISPSSAAPLSAPIPATTLIVVRELDLAGITIRQIKLADLNARLKSAGYDLVLTTFHHDVAVLPNGHWLLLANSLRNFASVAGYTGPQNALGDAIVDLDTDLNPVWVWNEFDHLDINRHPYLFPDWTHSNAVIYSPDDGNILVSSRHQSWVMKVNYNNGQGDGALLWRLGYQGDFTLLGGTDPTDWQFAQHYPSFVGASTAGTFGLTLMDNGNDRIGADGNMCGTSGERACYTTVPIFQIDENAKTATIAWRRKLPANLFSFFGGNSTQLANGNIEYDLAGVFPGSVIQEVTPDSSQTVVWQLVTPGHEDYRAFRIPSLYPGVQW